MQAREWLLWQAEKALPAAQSLAGWHMRKPCLLRKPCTCASWPCMACANTRWFACPPGFTERLHASSQGGISMIWGKSSDAGNDGGGL